MAETISAEVVVPYGGATYRLIYDWGAIEYFETAAPLSFAEFVVQLVMADMDAGPMPKLIHLALFVQAGLRRHHPDVDAEQAFAMWNDDGVRRAISGAADKAMPKAAPEGEAPRAAGKRSTRTKPAARSPRRGAKRANG